MLIIDDQTNDSFKFDPERVHRYKVILRRNRLFGFWAGEQLGKLDCELLHYSAVVVDADLEEPGDLDMLGKVSDDLVRAGISVSEADLHAKLIEFHEQAQREIGELSDNQSPS